VNSRAPRSGRRPMGQEGQRAGMGASGSRWGPAFGVEAQRWRPDLGMGLPDLDGGGSQHGVTAVEGGVGQTGRQ
jgi:hypothetical protein